MKNIKTMISAALMLGLSLTNVYAQEATTASGGNASGNGGSVSYSVGQVMYITSVGTCGSAAQGVQQPFEISDETGIEVQTGNNFNISVYPNPTDNFVILNVGNYDIESLSYQVYDINGKLLENERIASNETSIFMYNLVPAMYFIKVFRGNEKIKVFKVIKN